MTAAVNEVAAPLEVIAEFRDQRTLRDPYLALYARKPAPARHRRRPASSGRYSGCALLVSAAMTALPEAGNVTVDEVLECLNRYRLRATYQAVGVLIGRHWRQVGPELGDAEPRTSWVVLKTDPGRGLPSPEGFPDDQPWLRHQDLRLRDHIIEDPEELLALITAHRVRSLINCW